MPHDLVTMLDGALTAEVTTGGGVVPAGTETAASGVRSYAAVAKWGGALDGGFQIVPDSLVRHCGDLKLTPTELTVVLHLSMAWWHAGVKPFPRVSTVAKRMKVDARTIQRVLVSLRRKGYVRWEYVPMRGGRRRRYDLTGLVEALKPWAEKDRVLRATHTD